MLLFNASLINLTRSLISLENNRLLSSQSEHDEWMTLKLNTVPYAFAEGNYKLHAKEIFRNEKAYAFFREAECESTCYYKSRYNQETDEYEYVYSCTKYIDDLDEHVNGFYDGMLCSYFSYFNECRQADRSVTYDEESAYSNVLSIVTRSRFTWLSLMEQSGLISSIMSSSFYTTDELYEKLITETDPMYYSYYEWADVYTDEGFGLAKTMANSVCDSSCYLHFYANGEVHIDNSCVVNYNGLNYAGVYNYELCPYVQSYVDCTKPPKKTYSYPIIFTPSPSVSQTTNKYDELMSITIVNSIILSMIVLGFIVGGLIICIYPCCVRNKPISIPLPEYSSDSSEPAAQSPV